MRTLGNIELAEGTHVKNLTAPSGPTFPDNANLAELFELTEVFGDYATGMYRHNGEDWVLVPEGESFSKEEKEKLANVQANATKNESDGHLLDRKNHTGLQGKDTVEGLVASLKSWVTAAYLNQQTDVLNAEILKIPLDAIHADHGDWFDPVNNRIKPTMPGNYLIIGTVSFTFSPVGAGKRIIAYLYKNDISIFAATGSSHESTTNIVTAIAVEPFDGVDDYIDLRGRFDFADTTGKISAGVANTCLRVVRLGDLP